MARRLRTLPRPQRRARRRRVERVGTGSGSPHTVALERARDELREEVEAHMFYQFLFFRQWFALKTYANERGISIVGDLPIFVAQDSADVWTNPGAVQARQKRKTDCCGRRPARLFQQHRSALG